MEVTHSVKDEFNLSCGCALVHRPSAFASASVNTRGRYYLGLFYLLVFNIPNAILLNQLNEIILFIPF